MALPIELIIILACVGVFSIAGFLVWGSSNLIYWMRYKQFKPDPQQLQYKHELATAQAQLQSVQNALEVQQGTVLTLNNQLEEVLEKMVKRI